MNGSLEFLIQRPPETALFHTDTGLFLINSTSISPCVFFPMGQGSSTYVGKY